MIKGDAPKIQVVFYRTLSGSEPVREWLKTLDPDDRRVLGQDLQRLQYRWPVGMPLCRALRGGLWEVRTSLPSRRIARVIFCQHDDVLVALHGFIKKTQKTPYDDLALAASRKQEIDHADARQPASRRPT